MRWCGCWGAQEWWGRWGQWALEWAMDRSKLVRNAVLGLVVSVGLALGKLVAGVLGRSTALVADAVESLADSVGSIIVLSGLMVAERPADEQHPYGYGKAEALAALGVGVLLGLSAVAIVWQSVHEMLVQHAAPAWWTLVVLGVVVGIKEILFRRTLATAEALGSDAGRADAWHHRSDAITSVAAFIGVSVAVFGPGLTGLGWLVLADEVAALIASGVIVHTAWGLGVPALRELLDADAPGLGRAVRAAAESVEGVMLVEKLHTRKSGSGHHVDMHLHVRGELSVREAHALAGRVRAHVRSTVAGVRDVLIHIEPGEERA